MKFLDGRSQSGTGTWQKLSTSHSYKSWSGFAFETICLKHVQQIKQALRIDAIYSTHSSWFNANAQIDLLIDRSDNVMNICELKFHNGPFSIDKRTHSDLLNKIYELRASTKTRKNIFITLITTFGINENQYSRAILNNALSIDSLFSS